MSGDILTGENIGSAAYPLITDDAAARRIVDSQFRIEKLVRLALFGLIALLSIPEVWEVLANAGPKGLLKLLPFFFVLFIAYKIVHALIRLLFLKVLRAFRFRRCLAVIEKTAQSRIGVEMWNSWVDPAPAFMASDPIRRLLFLEGHQTGYMALVLEPDHIVEVKVERQQSTVTTTTHSSRTIYASLFPTRVFGVGRIGGGMSRSTSTMMETASLEIVYRLPDRSTRRIALNFGSDRRRADDWAVAIRHLGH